MAASNNHHSNIRILIADDHAIVRQGLQQILQEKYTSASFGEASTGNEVLDKIKKEKWDLLILDITMPGRSCLEILKQIKLESIKVPVLILSMHSEDQYAIRMLKSGAAGYLTKESAAEELLNAIQRVLSGHKYINISIAEKLANNLETDVDKPLHELMSDREFQVLCLIASGKTVSEIAFELSLSVATISTYRTRILDKLNMRTNAELTRYAIQLGLA